MPALADSGCADMPIEDALTMSFGVAFDENCENPMSDINTLFIRAMANGIPVEQTLSGLERECVPGTYNDYIRSDLMALGLVLEAATGMRQAFNLRPLQRWIFTPSHRDQTTVGSLKDHGDLVFFQQRPLTGSQTMR